MATQLLGATQLSEKLGAENVEWKNDQGVFVEYTFSRTPMLFVGSCFAKVYSDS